MKQYEIAHGVHNCQLVVYLQMFNKVYALLYEHRVRFLHDELTSHVTISLFAPSFVN